MIDRMIDQSFDHIMINQTNSLGSIDHLIISQLIELIYYNQSDDQSN
jgi:hypothetical protein